jgi:hypothetical protein
MPIVSFPEKPDLPEDELSSIVQAVLNLLTKALTDRGPHLPQLIYHYTDPFGLKGIVLLSQKVAGVSQKVAGDGGENLVFGGDWHISIGGLRWVAEEWRTVNRGLLPMSRVL